jgi:DNA repair exonuclease SbcCD ATPase subunit
MDQQQQPAPPPQPDDPCVPRPDLPLAQQLARLRQCSEQRQRDQKKADANAQLADAEIAVLAQFLDDLDKIVADYDKAQPPLEAAQEKYKGFESGEEKILADQLGEKALGDIKTAAKPFEEEINKLPDDIDGLTADLANLRLQRDKAAKERDDKKAEFENWKKPVAYIRTRHAGIDGIRKQFDAAMDAGELAYAYWLLTGLKKYKYAVDTMPAVFPTPAFREELITAWQKYDGAIKNFQDLDGQIKGREKELDLMNARLKIAKDKLDARVRDAVANIEPAN